MINKVILIGNVGSDPETRYAPSGSAICNFRIATSESWKDKATGERKEKTEWHSCVAFDKLAEIIAQYAVKGTKMYVEGKLQTRKWQDKDGHDQYRTEVRVEEMKLLGSPNRDGARPAQGDSGGGQKQPSPAQNPAPQAGRESPNEGYDPASFDDDIPF